MSLPDITTADVTVARGEVARTRYATECRIRELMDRFEARPLADGRFQVWDRETHAFLPDVYADSAMARAGEKVAASEAIRRLFDVK